MAGPALAAVCLAALPLGCGGGGENHPPLTFTYTPPAEPMPPPGGRTVFQVDARGGTAVRFRWFKDGVPITGATGPALVLDPVALADAGSYWVRITDGDTALETPPFSLEPADTALVVTNPADQGPGTLRDLLAQANARTGVNGIRFDLGAGPQVITLASDLPPVTGTVKILGPGAGTLTLDGGGDPAHGNAGGHRPFFVEGGSLTLDHFTVAHGLAKGGDGPEGGGGGAGAGGAVFVKSGQLSLVRMTFRDNRAQGGAGGLGGDGEAGGGGGFGGDGQPGGAGGPAGFLMGEPGRGRLDGSSQNGDSATGGAGGGGGGAVRGGPLDRDPDDPDQPWAANAAGGDGGWGGGGGFSVGPAGGGGAGGFGGGGGASGGRVTLDVGGVASERWFAGAARGAAGLFGGDGGTGDGIARTGQGGGGAGLGGAVFLRAGTLSMAGCVFTGNRAEGGAGAEYGLGKGGAVFIYALADHAPMDPAALSGQTYQGNVAADAGVEGAAYDNNDFYIAQTSLLLAPAWAPLPSRYRAYRLTRRPAGSRP